MRLTFEQQVAIAYLHTSNTDDSVPVDLYTKLNKRPQPDARDIETWMKWVNEGEGRFAALRAEAFVKGFTAHQDAAWDGIA